MPQYRKRPIVINAFQMTQPVYNEELYWPKWIVEAFENKVMYYDMKRYINSVWWEDDKYQICIHTLEGIMYVDIDDWIIQGVQNELYPCKPDIFAATYEPV